MILPSPAKKLFTAYTDYENLNKYFPRQLQKITILSETQNECITEESISISSLIKFNTIQKTIHKIISDTSIESVILEGPLKGTVVNTNFTQKESETEIVLSCELKTTLKYKILIPIIKKEYKNILRALFYKINTDIMQ